MRHFVINERIRGQEVRLIGADGKQLGIVAVPDAIAAAKEQGFDLVLISPNSTPPVCKIADVGKLKYEESKREKEARKAQRGGDVKEIKLSPKIAQHDFAVRVKKSKEFLTEKNKVKLTMFFRGREMAHVDLGMKVLDRLVAEVAELGAPEDRAKRFGKRFVLVIAPK